MQNHIAYWKPVVLKGIVLVPVPVFNKRGRFGFAIIGVDNEKQLETLIANDSANGLGQYETFTMRVTSKFIEN